MYQRNGGESAYAMRLRTHLPCTTAQSISEGDEEYNPDSSATDGMVSFTSSFVPNVADGTRRAPKNATLAFHHSLPFPWKLFLKSVDDLPARLGGTQNQSPLSL